ncbi:hypothetical protein AAG906_010365 [Vitis piasezkii]
MDGMQNDLSQKIDNLQYSISRLTNLNTVQEKGRFPSQPHQNPKGIHEVETHEGESSHGKRLSCQHPSHMLKRKKKKRQRKWRKSKERRKISVKGKRTMIQQ